MADLEADSARVVVETTIQAPVDRVFPLCCPVAEYKWISGWKCKLVHCPNDRVEEGCVFSEILSAPFLQRSIRGRTTWTAVLHDTVSHRLHFVLNNEVCESVYKIELRAAPDDATSVTLDFTCTPHTERGRRIVASNGAARITVMLDLVALMLKHYCETGEMLTIGRIAGRVMRADALTLADRFRIGMNRVAMALTADPYRKQYLRTVA